MIDTKSSILKGKKGLVIGIANERSLAWGIADCVAKHGGELALTYQNEALQKRIIPLAEKVIIIRVGIKNIKVSSLSIKIFLIAGSSNQAIPEVLAATIIEKKAAKNILFKNLFE